MKLDNPRSIKMVEMFKSGKTLQEIGDIYGLSRERVRQIISKLGVLRTDGGQHKTSKEKAQIRREAFLNTWLPKYKCLRKEYLDITKGEKRRAGVNTHISLRYYKQNVNAKNRGVDFNLTFPQWYKIWQDSGHINEMGVAGYCMAREKDEGAYEIGNVRIISASQNHSDAWKYKDWSHKLIHTHCINGHEFIKENTYTWRGKRFCRICLRERARKKYLKNKNK